MLCGYLGVAEEKATSCPGMGRLSVKACFSGKRATYATERRQEFLHLGAKEM
jgi:hypothetical protein